MEDVTIYDIAMRAGVSASTVSRVINNYQYVKDDTRAKIIKIMNECNFVPNDTARSLTTKTSRMIGILIADLRTTHHTDGVYVIEHEFSKNGYACLIYNTGADPESQASYIQLLSQRKIDAVVMMGSVYQNEAVQKAIETYIPQIPVAICNGYLDGENIYGIVSDEEGGVSDCVRLLAESGHKDIAFISNHMTPSNLGKVKGFEAGFRRFIPDGHKVVIEAGDKISDVVAATENLIKENEKISAIMYSEDYIALIGIHALVSNGIMIPEKVAVIGINNSRFGEISNPSLTTLDNMLYEMSIMAVQCILKALAGISVEKRILIPTKIIERASTGNSGQSGKLNLKGLID